MGQSKQSDTEGDQARELYGFFRLFFFFGLFSKFFLFKYVHFGISCLWGFPPVSADIWLLIMFMSEALHSRWGIWVGA